MAYTALQVADAVWTASTRTLASGASTTGTTAATRIADAVWTYTTRTLTSVAQTGLPATGISLSGPANTYVGQSSLYYVSLTPAGSTSASVVVTPTSTTAGTFSPATITLSTAQPTGSFTFTPSAVGSGTIATTNSGGLTAPAALAYSAVVSVFGITTFSGPEHTVTINIGPMEMFVRHLSDKQIDQLRIATPTKELAVDLTNLTVYTSN